MPYGAEESRCAVRKTNSEFLNVVINASADRIVESYNYIGLVLRVKSIEKSLQRNRAMFGIEAMQTNGLVRDVMYLPRREISRPTADVSQALRFRQVRLLPSQLLSQKLLRRNVHGGAMKPLKNSVFNHRNTHTTDVTYLSVWSNYSLRYIAPAALLMHGLYRFSHGGSVLGVDPS